MRNANRLKRGNPISFVFVKNVYITIKKQIHMIFCPFISTVRLLNSNTSFPRVEVLFGGFWGPICNSLGIQPANIVCRELGYEKAYAVVDSGQRNVEICLDTSSMRCMGNETSILRCQSIIDLATVPQQPASFVLLQVFFFYIMRTRSFFLIRNYQY